LLIGKIGFSATLDDADSAVHVFHDVDFCADQVGLEEAAEGFARCSCVGRGPNEEGDGALCDGEGSLKAFPSCTREFYVV